MCGTGPHQATPGRQAFEADEEVVFIHTGGAPALFGYRWALPTEDLAG